MKTANPSLTVAAQNQRFRAARVSAFSLVTAFLFSLPVKAQDCRLEGFLVDSQHAVVASAIVNVTALAGGSVRQVLADAHGHFQLMPVPPGKYRIEAVKPGFEALLRTEAAVCGSSGATLILENQRSASQTSLTVQALPTSGGSLLTYICGSEPGSGCETIQPGLLDSNFDLTAGIVQP